MMLACTIFGHRPAFSADGATLRWACDRCGMDAGAKTYASAEDARRYASAFNRRDTDAMGKRAPLIGLLPLRLWRRFGKR
jgi:hypothetical protein